MKKILFISIMFLFFNGCTVIFTEIAKERMKNIKDTTTQYFEPNESNMSTSLANIDDISNETITIDSNIKNEFRNIDSILKNYQLDSNGWFIQIDTLIDSTGKQIFKNTGYGYGKIEKITWNGKEPEIKSTFSKDNVHVVEVFTDNSNDIIDIKTRIYGENGTISSVSFKPDKILGFIPWVKDISIQQSEYIVDTTTNSDYNIAITSLDDSYYPDSIVVHLTIQNSKDEFVSGLAQPYLSNNRSYKDFWKDISDSCSNTKTNVSDFKVEEVREVSSTKHNICFVLDHSGSMGESRCVSLQQTVYYISKHLNESDYLSAIKFKTTPLVEVEPIQDKDLFRKLFKINGMTGGGGNDVVKALDKSIEVLSKVPSDYNRIIILFSDGEDNMNGLNDVMKKLIDNKCRVFSICYGSSNFINMTKVARGTNGKVYRIKDVRDFAAAFKEIYAILNNYYKIVYKPAQCADIHSVTVNLELPVLNASSSNLYSVQGEYDKSIFTNLAEVGTMQLVDIEFEYAKATIDSSSMPTLLEITKQLQRNQEVRVRIAGHTDNIGDDKYNELLSLNRAQSVRDFLIKNGINADRLEVVGYGKSRPIVDNDTESNRKRNRRTEFIVID